MNADVTCDFTAGSVALRLLCKYIGIKGLTLVCQATQHRSAAAAGQDCSNDTLRKKSFLSSGYGLRDSLVDFWLLMFRGTTYKRYDRKAWRRYREHGGHGPKKLYGRAIMHLSILKIGLCIWYIVSKAEVTGTK